jgi:hypothetical protein
MTSAPSASNTSVPSADLDPTGGDWQWEPQPEAQKLIDELLLTFSQRCPDALRLAERMRAETGTRFKDWVGVILTPDTPEIRSRLEAACFEPIATEFSDADIHNAFDCRRGLFPPVLLTDSDRMSVGIKVESVADYFAAQHVPGIEHVQGQPLSRARWAKVADGDRAALWVMERHGYDAFGLSDDLADECIAAQHFLERFRGRARSFESSSDGFEDLHRLVDAAIEEIGRDWACDLFFKAERDYWMSRNTAGRVQFARQQALGLGWANHDHHTYRNTRENYTQMIALFEKLGFFCRERFYAGGEAGWGAQVLEHPVTGITIFADVDMTPDEVKGDFAHEGFGPKEGVGTIGLWCHLHGESLLDAGMHHLECQFDHAALTEQLEAEAGITTMDPFTSFPHLKQAFTEGERWVVREDRIETAVRNGWITTEQAEAFRTTGALGSHLENLERNDGFKGFNQTGVSDIIGRTDARKHT